MSRNTKAWTLKSELRTSDLKYIISINILIMIEGRLPFFFVFFFARGGYNITCGGGKGV